MGLKDKSTNHHLNPRDLIPSTKIVGSSFQTLSTSLSHKHHLSPIRRSTTRLTTDSVQLLSASTTNIASDYAISPEQVTSESTNNNYFSLSSNSNYNYIVKSSGVIRRKPLLVLTFNHTRPTKASLHFDSDCSLSSGLLLTRSRAIGGVTISSEGDNLTRERFLSITRYHRLRLKRIYEVQRALRQQEGELNKLTLSAVEIRAKIELIEKFETYIEWLKRSQPQLSDKVFYCRHKDQSIDKCEFDSVGTANFKMIHRVGTLSPSRYKFLDDTGEVSKPKRSRVPQNRVASESSSKIEALSRGLQENLVLSSVSSFSAAGSVGDGEHATDIKTRAVSTPSKLLSPSPLLSSTSHASISAEGTDASAHSSQHTSIVLPSPTSSITSKNSKRHERPENIDILSPNSSKSQLSFISSSGSSVVKSPTSGSENSKSTNSSFKVSPKRTITQRHSKRSLKEKKLPPLPISNDSSSASTSSRGPSPVHSKSMSLSGNNESVVSKIHHRTSSLEATKLGMVQSSSCALSISPINVQRSPIKKYFDLSAKPSELIQYDTAENDDNKASKIREMSMIEDINQTMNLSIREKEEQDLEPQIYSKQKNCNHNNEVKIESETKDTPINGKETNTLSLNTIVLQQPVHSFNQLGAPADSFGISYSSSLKDFTECMSKEYSSVSRESSPIKDMSDITLTEISSEISKSELTKELITDTCEVSNTTVLSKNLSQKSSNQTFIQTSECQLPLSTRSSSLQYLEHSIPSPPEETDYSFAFNSDQVSKHEIMPRSPGSESVVDIPTPATFDFDNVELCHSPIQSILSKSYNNQACNINFGVTSDEGIGLSDGTYNIETSRASTSSDSIMRDSKIGDRKNISLISTASSVFSNVSEADIYNGSGADIGTPSLTLSKARYSGSASSYVNSLRPSIHSPTLTDFGEAFQSPEDQRRIKKKFNLIRELVDTEDSFATDMGVAIDIYARLLHSEKYFGYICKDDIKILFEKVEKIQLLSRQFTRALRNVIPPYIFESKNSPSDKQLMDVTTRIGAVFLDFIPRFEEPYKDYCDDNKSQMETFYRIKALACPLIDIWMVQALEESENLTKAWNLDALLIKPVQRLLKYPLLLNSMLDVTLENHGDYENLRQAAFEMEACATRINSDHMVSIMPTSSKTSLDEEMTGMRGLATDHTADRALQDLLKIFYSKAKRVRDLIRAIKANSREIQSHFDSNGQLAKVWLSWVMALGVDEEDPLKLKRYKHYTLFSSPFTSTSSTLLSSSKLAHKIDEEVMSVLRQVFNMYERTEILIADRQRYHNTYMKYISYKREDNTLLTGNSASIQQRLDSLQPDIYRADLFIRYHNSLKDGLPDLFTLTQEMIELCMEKYVNIQRQWFRMAVDAMATVFNIRVDEIRNPDGSDPIVEKFRQSISPTGEKIGKLGICNQELFDGTVSGELERWDSDEMLEVSEDSVSIFSHERKVSENKTIGSESEDNDKVQSRCSIEELTSVDYRDPISVTEATNEGKKLRRKSSILTLTNWPNKTVRKKASNLESTHEL